eukprot:10319079-Ditylum_brightwellii.AAC.1
MSHSLEITCSMSTSNKISINGHKIHTKLFMDTLEDNHKILKDKVDLFDVSKLKAICSSNTGLAGNVKLHQHLEVFKKETNLTFTTINESLDTHHNNISTLQLSQNKLSDNIKLIQSSKPKTIHDSDKTQDLYRSLSNKLGHQKKEYTNKLISLDTKITNCIKSVSEASSKVDIFDNSLQKMTKIYRECKHKSMT